MDRKVLMVLWIECKDRGSWVILWKSKPDGVSRPGRGDGLHAEKYDALHMSHYIALVVRMSSSECKWSSPFEKFVKVKTFEIRRTSLRSFPTPSRHSWTLFHNKQSQMSFRPKWAYYIGYICQCDLIRGLVDGCRRRREQR